MNKIFPLLLALTAAVTLSYVIKVVISITPKNKNVLEQQIIVSTELNNISQADIDGLKKEVREALKYITPILGIDYEKAIEIKIVNQGSICSASGGVVSLLISHIRDKGSPVIHEVTHVIARHGHNSFFSEGLAVYFQERFGENPVFPNFSLPINDLIRMSKNQLIPITRLMNDNEIFKQVETQQRKMAYLTAGSFTSFLVEKHGEQKLADLNNSETLNYEKVYGKTIDELETEWKSYYWITKLDIF
jgi:hypothetical protein